jgi:hypothetical protein
MIIELAATTTEQIPGHSSRTATMAARPPPFLFVCAKRQPATPIRKLRFAPSSGLISNNVKHSLAISQFGCSPWVKVKKRQHHAFGRVMDQFG